MLCRVLMVGRVSHDGRIFVEKNISFALDLETYDQVFQYLEDKVKRYLADPIVFEVRIMCRIGPGEFFDGCFNGYDIGFSRKKSD